MYICLDIIEQTLIIYYAWRVGVSLPGVISYVNKVYGMFNHLRSCVSTSSI